ncbi:MAG TPA: hypothetical protein VHY56_03760, partial [Candidatus Binataceae bacterium]|nr:hypothetical protein [Candidatus Binataceae bacterium]
FIYLANAVNDLRSNWKTLALVLAPTAVLAALCLLPDALNLQHGLAQRFAPGLHDVMDLRFSSGMLAASHPHTLASEGYVGWRPAQESYPPAAVSGPPLFSHAQIVVAHLGFLLLTLIGNLLVLCTIKQAQASGAARPEITRAAEIFRHAIEIAPAYAWVTLLQLALPAMAVIAFQFDFTVSSGSLAIALYFLLLGLMVLGGLLYLWLYFAPYALIFDGKHSFHALLFSRDLLRKRFFRVATRIVVFLAVWSGYNSWAAIAFIVTSLFVGPVAVLTGSVWLMIFLVDLGAVIVNFATTAFFIAAGVRLYRDLGAEFAGSQPLETASGQTPAMPLVEVSSSAAS